MNSIKNKFIFTTVLKLSAKLNITQQLTVIIIIAAKFQNLPNQIHAIYTTKLSKPMPIIKHNRYKIQYKVKFNISWEGLIKLILFAVKLQVLLIIFIKLFIPLSTSKKSYFIASDFNIVTKNVVIL